MERLLVAQTGFLGDVVLTTPLLSTLRCELDLESLTVLTTPQAQPLVQDHPAVDNVLVDSKRGNGPRVSRSAANGSSTPTPALYANGRTA